MPVALSSLPAAVRRKVQAGQRKTAPAAAEPRKKSKYGAKRVDVDGHSFSSKKEARRYLVLRDLLRAGEISELQLQPSFVLAPAVRFDGEARQKPALRYFGDFAYRNRAGVLIVEDVKGVQTEGFRIKRHLMRSLHGIDITLIK